MSKEFRLEVMRSSISENLMRILNDELHSVVLRMHIRHLTFQTMVPHNRWSEDDSDVLRCHLKTVSTSSSNESRSNGINIPSSRYFSWPRDQDGRSRIRDNPYVWVAAY